MPITSSSVNTVHSLPRGGLAWGLALAIIVSYFGFTPPASGQERTDKVEYWLRGKDSVKTIRTGMVMEESPAKVVLRQMNGERLEIPAEDVIDIDYEGAPSATILAKSAERNRQWDQAQQQYEKALKELKPNQRSLELSLRFRLADLAFQQTQAGESSKVDGALSAFRQFLKDYTSCRQTLPAWERLGRLLVSQGARVDEAVAGLRGVKEKVSDPPGFAARCDLIAIRLVLLEAQNPRLSQSISARERFGEALAWIERLQETVQGPVLQEIRRLRPTALAGAGKRAEALQAIDSLIAAAEDDRGRAQLLLDRGDVKRILAQPAEARWDYLRVELLYSQERDLQTKALERLAEVFTELGDTARARDYRERLKK